MDNKDIKNELNIKKDKKHIVFKIVKIILILALYLVAIFVCCKSCKKVGAYTRDYITYDTYENISLNNTTGNLGVRSCRYDYFYLYDIINQSNQDLTIYTLINYGDTQFFNIVINNRNNGGNFIHIMVNSTNNYHSNFYQGSFNENYVLVVSNYGIINSNICTIHNVVSLIEYDSQDESKYQLIAENSVSRDFDMSNNSQFRLYLYNSYWVTSRYTNSIPIDESDFVKIGWFLVNTDMPFHAPIIYRNEYLFGDLVSSFLNIQLGSFNLGGTLVNLRIGTLLLFMLGIGALFIIIKVMLGG